MSQKSNINKTEIASGELIKVEGKKLRLNDQPYIFMGTNMWYAANLAAEGFQDRLIRELDQLEKLGIKNLRILGASEGSGSFRINKSFQPELGVYDESLLKGLDFVLSEMGKRGMHAVIYLNNFWEWSGGMAQYVSWIKGQPFPKPILDERDRPAFMEHSARFYSIPSAMQAFRDYISMLIKRTNSITGIPYRDDPTIMSWQLANEPRPGRPEDVQSNKTSYLNWIKETANFIKELDSDHLVSTGSEGLVGSGLSEEIFLSAHEIAEIDYLTFHLWAYNWGWFDPKDEENTFPVAITNAKDYIEEHYELANTLNKPLTLEEFGFLRDLKSYDPESSTKWRDKYYSQILSIVYDNALKNGPISGTNFWAWGGLGSPSKPDYLWEPGVEYIGDPPHEPQGFYSVFSSDDSTLAVLEKYAKMCI